MLDLTTRIARPTKDTGVVEIQFAIQRSRGSAQQSSCSNRVEGEHLHEASLEEQMRHRMGDLEIHLRKLELYEKFLQLG